MAVANRKEIIRKVYQALPKLNCGLCGYANCGQLARAVAEGKASPFSCQQNPWAGYRISEIIGLEAPALGYRYGFRQPLFAQKTQPPASLRKEVAELFQRTDDILARIEELGRK
jgi:Na+-translocating ferredoxin:NAD+ oxidoreductase RNF subunit RnfB